VDESGGESYGVFALISTAGPDELTLGQADIPGKLFAIFFGAGDDPTSAEFEQHYPNRTEMDADMPNGAVIFQIIDSGFATFNGSISVTGDAYPTASPHGNYAAARAIDPKAGFSLPWNPFTGATANDRIEVVITDEQDRTVLQAPNECANPPVTLANTATSIQLAANLLAEGKTHTAEPRFQKIGATATSAAPAYEGTSGYGHVTKFTLKTTGGVPDVVTITGYRVAADGRFEVDVQTGPGKTEFLEVWVNLSTWEQVNGAVTGANGQATPRDRRTRVPSSPAYRVRTQPGETMDSKRRGGLRAATLVWREGNCRPQRDRPATLPASPRSAAAYLARRNLWVIPVRSSSTRSRAASSPSNRFSPTPATPRDVPRSECIAAALRSMTSATSEISARSSSRTSCAVTSNSVALA
jgi:hypothetical protein